MFSNLRYLVLSGGAARGLLFLGAFGILENFLKTTYHSSIKTHFMGYGGTSVGSLVLLHLLCEGDDTEIDRLINTPVHQLQTVTKNAIRDLLQRKCNDPNISFRDFCSWVGRKFKVCACNLNTLELKIFGDDETPDVKVADAINASIAIPLLFEPVLIEENLYCDGGCQLNLPIGVFPLHETLAFWIRVRYEPVSLTSLQEPSALCRRVAELFFYGQDSVIDYFLVKTRNIVCFEAQTPAFIVNNIADIQGLREKGWITMFKYLLEKDEMKMLRFLSIFFVYLFQTPKFNKSPCIDDVGTDFSFLEK
jgi:hypothetical protein